MTFCICLPMSYLQKVKQQSISESICKCKVVSFLTCRQRSRIYAGLELEFILPGTVAKFIIKSSLLSLSLNKVFSAWTAAERCTTAHYYHFSQTCINANVACFVISLVVHKYFQDALFSLLQILPFLFCQLQFFAIRYLSKNGCR